MGLAQELRKRQPFASAREEAYLNVLRTAEHLSGAFDALFKSRGLSQPQYNALRILRGHAEPIPSGTVAAEMVNRQPDITRLLDRLAGRGLVTRGRSARDGRIVLAQLTRDGERLADELSGPVDELHRRMLGHLPDEELRKVSRLLEAARRAEPTPDDSGPA